MATRCCRLHHSWPSRSIAPIVTTSASALRARSSDVVRKARLLWWSKISVNWTDARKSSCDKYTQICNEQASATCNTTKYSRISRLTFLIVTCGGSRQILTRTSGNSVWWIWSWRSRRLEMQGTASRLHCWQKILFAAPKERWASMKLWICVTLSIWKLQTRT